MVEEGTLDGGPKGGGKKELGEGAWVSPIPWVSGKPKYDKIT